MQFISFKPEVERTMETLTWAKEEEYPSFGGRRHLRPSGRDSSSTCCSRLCLKHLATTNYERNKTYTPFCQMDKGGQKCWVMSECAKRRSPGRMRRVLTSNKKVRVPTRTPCNMISLHQLSRATLRHHSARTLLLREQLLREIEW